MLLVFSEYGQKFIPILCQKQCGGMEKAQLQKFGGIFPIIVYAFRVIARIVLRKDTINICTMSRSSLKTSLQRKGGRTIFRRAIFYRNVGEITNLGKSRDTLVLKKLLCGEIIVVHISLPATCSYYLN